MKKIVYILPLLLLGIMSCDPMEDVYNEIDEANKEAKEIEKFFAQRTLLEDEYTLIDSDYSLSSNESLSKYKNFSSRATAKDNLAEILNAKMVYGEAGKDYKVTYKFYRGSLPYVKTYLPYLEAVSEMKKYTLKKEDYDSMGTEKGKPGKYDNFSEKMPASDYLPDFLKKKFSKAKAQDIVIVTYKFYNGSSASDVTETWQFDGTVWAEIADAAPKAPKLPKGVEAYTLSAADYDSMGAPGKHDNFSDEQKPQNYLPTFLGIKFPYAKEGAKYLVVYKFYGKKKKDDEKKSVFLKAQEYTFTAGAWKAYSVTIMKVATMSYKVDKKTWEFVPPITFVKTDEKEKYSYTLNDADYELVGNGRFHNFDLRAGKEDADESVFLKKITTILKSQTIVPVEAGSVYAVTYTYYDGQKGEKTINLKAVLEE